MNFIFFLLPVFFFCLSISAMLRPNVIVVLVDDMGYSDLGSFGGEVKTPHLDRLAANGLRFTQNYNSARCCPSRAS
ncbi:MAG: sulfatase-like hydrolase/transferase, partial [Opitutae bacterium]|nr:sulfatase-like hydrolase/transferase [Opitutae bacterium]